MAYPQTEKRRDKPTPVSPAVVTPRDTLPVTAGKVVGAIGNAARTLVDVPYRAGQKLGNFIDEQASQAGTLVSDTVAGAKTGTTAPATVPGPTRQRFAVAPASTSPPPVPAAPRTLAAPAPSGPRPGDTNTFTGANGVVRSLQPDGSFSGQGSGQSGQQGTFNTVSAAAFAPPPPSERTLQFRAEVAAADNRNANTRARIAANGQVKSAAEGDFRPGTGAGLNGADRAVLAAEQGVARSQARQGQTQLAITDANNATRLQESAGDNAARLLELGAAGDNALALETSRQGAPQIQLGADGKQYRVGANGAEVITTTDGSPFSPALPERDNPRAKIVADLAPKLLEAATPLGGFKTDEARQQAEANVLTQIDAILARAGLPVAASAAPAAGAGGERAVKRTGTLNGRKVVEYTDGTTEYAD